MRPVSIVLCVAPVALNGFSLAPASNRFQWYVLAASLVLALALLVLMLVGRGRRPQAKTEPGPVFLLQADKLHGVLPTLRAAAPAGGPSIPTFGAPSL